MRKIKDYYLTHWKELTKQMRKLECYLALNREYTEAEYLTTVTDTVVKRARQSLFPLRKLKRFGMGPEILKRFYRCHSESMVASLPGTAISRPLTARHYKG